MAFRNIILIDGFLKKHPNNCEMKIECAQWIHHYLYAGKKRGEYDIPNDEFEDLKSKGFRMAESVKKNYNDPNRISRATDTLVWLYCLEENWEKAKETALILPNNNSSSLKIVKWIKDAPNACYNYVIADDDNILSREERFKACRARLDAIE